MGRTGSAGRISLKNALDVGHSELSTPLDVAERENRDRIGVGFMETVCPPGLYDHAVRENLQNPARDHAVGGKGSAHFPGDGGRGLDGRRVLLRVQVNVEQFGCGDRELHDLLNDLCHSISLFLCVLSGLKMNRMVKCSHVNRLCRAVLSLDITKTLGLV